MTDKNAVLLESFTAYCRANPEQRFWQALRNWCGWPFVLVAGENSGHLYFNLRFHDMEDTFYWEENWPAPEPKGEL